MMEDEENLMRVGELAINRPESSNKIVALSKLSSEIILNNFNKEKDIMNSVNDSMITPDNAQKDADSWRNYLDGFDMKITSQSNAASFDKNKEIISISNQEEPTVITNSKERQNISSKINRISQINRQIMNKKLGKEYNSITNFVTVIKKSKQTKEGLSTPSTCSKFFKHLIDFKPQDKDKDAQRVAHSREAALTSPKHSFSTMSRPKTTNTAVSKRHYIDASHDKNVQTPRSMNSS
jgi:hypothetical protein